LKVNCKLSIEKWSLVIEAGASPIRKARTPSPFGAAEDQGRAEGPTGVPCGQSSMTNDHFSILDFQWTPSRRPSRLQTECLALGAASSTPATVRGLRGVVSA